MSWYIVSSLKPITSSVDMKMNWLSKASYSEILNCDLLFIWKLIIHLGIIFKYCTNIELHSKLSDHVSTTYAIEIIHIIFIFVYYFFFLSRRNAIINEKIFKCPRKVVFEYELNE